MDDIQSQLANMTIQPTIEQVLIHDAALMIDSWLANVDHIPAELYKIRACMFTDAVDLYQSLTKVLSKFRQRNAEYEVTVIDLMPYIDDYLEHYNHIYPETC
jgi:hypothetical protein